MIVAQRSLRRSASVLNKNLKNFSSETFPTEEAPPSTPSTTSTPHKSFSFEKMEKDRRYAPTMEAPASLSSPSEDPKDVAFALRGQFLEGRAAYLDSSATTPLDPRVLDQMLPHMIGFFGNPHSTSHSFGWDSEKSVEKGRGQIASLIGARQDQEIIFTSGATESNNIAVKGCARFYGRSGKKKHVVTTQVEHKCVLDSCRALESEGFEVTYLPVSRATGAIDLQQLEDALRPDTIMVSVLAVNNEIGTLQPLKQIGEMCRSRKIFFHTDAAQMLGKMPIDVEDMKIDLMSMSGHKVYGPKGIGALYVRRRPRVRLEALLSGGGQERGLRSGTLPHNLCVGFGAACELASQEMEFDTAWVNYLSEKLLNGIMEKVPDVVRNGNPELNYPGCLNVSFAYVEGESLVMALKNLAVSSGSACTSASLEPSYVLRALGVDDELAHSSLRFGLGRFTTEEEVDLVLELLEKHVGRLREMSPLWEMVQEGIDIKSIQWSQDEHDHSHSHAH